MSERSVRIALGASLVAAGLAGLLALGAATLVGTQTDPDAEEVREAMHQMMEAMHDPGTAHRTDHVPVADLFEQCAAWRAAHSGMTEE